MTAEPAGHFSASMIRVVAARRDLPQRRPAATTLNRVLSAKTVCCHGRREKLRSAMFRVDVLDVAVVVVFVVRQGVCADAQFVFNDLGGVAVANAGDVDGHGAALILVFFKHGCGESSIDTHLECSHLSWVVVVERDLDDFFDDVFTARLDEDFFQLFEASVIRFR